MYSCDIDVKADVLGKMYAVLSKRHGKIVEETMIEGSSMFTGQFLLQIIPIFLYYLSKNSTLHSMATANLKKSEDFVDLKFLKI